MCVDLDADKIARLASGVPTIYEPGLEELLASGIASGRLRFATPDDGWAELLGEVVFVAVGTPMGDNGGADLRSCVPSPTPLLPRRPHRYAGHEVDGAARNRLGADRRATWPTPAVEIGYVSNPEFLREGHAIYDWYHTDRVVIGGDDARAIDKVAELYASLDAPDRRDRRGKRRDHQVREQRLPLDQDQLHQRDRQPLRCLGADVDAVANGIGLDTRIGPAFLNAGIGYGGSCFPKDTRALDFIATMNGYQFDLLKAVIDVNNRQRLLPLIRLTDAIPDLWQHKVAVLGLSFKPLTDDVRESPRSRSSRCCSKRAREVTAFDPVAGPVDLGDAVRCDSVWEALEGASAAVLVTDWAELIELDWARVRSVMAGPGLIFDGRNALDAEAVTRAGLGYMAVGMPGSHRAPTE